MDAQLKQRLTGAVILVLLAVLFVPELLRGPRPGVPAGAAAPTAAQPAAAAAAGEGEGAPLRSYEIDLSDEPRAVEEPTDAAGPAAEPSPPVATPGAAPRAPAATNPADGRGRESVAARAPAAAAPPGADAAAPRPAQRPSPAPAAAVAAPPAAAAAVPQRGFAVQVGSFASRDTAERVANQLRSRRFETFVSPVRSGSRQLYRVRVGPVPDRAAAQALAGRLKSAGQKGSVVTLP